MRHHGQILSLDAMLALIMVVIMLGTITNTSSTLQNDILTMVSWYERANIANNMLDILTKSPGNPPNWSKDVSGLRVIGLRSDAYPYALDYNKLQKLALLKNNPFVIKSLLSLSEGKDFKLKAYLTEIRIQVSGDFPEKISIDMGTVEDRDIRIGAGYNAESAFRAENVTLNGQPLSQSSQPYSLATGDVLAFYALEDIVVVDTNNNVRYPIGAPAYVEIKTVSANSNLYVTWDSSGLYIKGSGQIGIIVDGYQEGALRINSTVEEPENLTSPTFTIAVINGTEVSNLTLVNKSKERSPWIEYMERKLLVAKIKYSKELIANSGKSDEWIAGMLSMNVPEYAYLKVVVNEGDRGEIIVVVQDGGEYRALLIKKDTAESSLTATVATTNRNVKPLFYTGNKTAIEIPWSTVFPTFDPNKGSKAIDVWVYKNTFNNPVRLIDAGNIDTLLEPEFERAILKLWVWEEP
ncbi:hypothetical protein [Thermococcus sp.]|uniref:hypothetical protein n=1 Tax=Thermococcus sp. TaxID=35749 RepID=UPI002606E577|nr:hypothetical protein [Thermococcus sp.]